MQLVFVMISLKTAHMLLNKNQALAHLKTELELSFIIHKFVY